MKDESLFSILLNSQLELFYVVQMIVWLIRTIMLPALLSMVLVYFTITFSNKYQVVAHPSLRGAHTIPTPRLGGMGGAAAFLITLLLFPTWGVDMPVSPWFLALTLGVVWALIGGALDDFQELPPRWKLLLQLAASGTVAAFQFAPSTLHLPFAGAVEIPALAGMLFAFFITFFMMNIFNFMDGMDGHTPLFSIVVGLTLALWLGTVSIATKGYADIHMIKWTRPLEAAAAALLASTMLGVLIHNYPGRSQSSKTFLGDCGSQFYGFALAVVALQSSEKGLQGAFPWGASLILFSPFIYDVVFTLIRRYRNGENLTQAHKTHLYQRLMVAGWSHGQTLRFNIGLWVAMAGLSWLYAAASNQQYGFVVVFCVVACAAVLAGYTFAVIDIEARAARQKARSEQEIRD